MPDILWLQQLTGNFISVELMIDKQYISSMLDILATSVDNYYKQKQ